MTRIEYRVASILKHHNIPVCAHNKVLQGTKYRPDFIIRKGSTVVVVEVDEHAHERYDKHREKIREELVSKRLNDMGHDVYVLRFDPYKTRLCKLMVDIVPIIRSLLEDRPVNHILERLRADVSDHVIRVY
jgi:very-short-patch-repair endonuclease